MIKDIPKKPNTAGLGVHEHFFILGGRFQLFDSCLIYGATHHSPRVHRHSIFDSLVIINNLIVL